MATATIAVPITERARLQLDRMAKRSRTTLQLYSRRILEAHLHDLPRESLDEYEHPERLLADIEHALKEYRQGRALTRL